MTKALGCPRHMPADWNPPAPAFRAIAGASQTLTVALFTVEGDLPSRHRFCAMLDIFFQAKAPPEHVERAEHSTRSGERATLSIGYWTDPATFDDWMNREFGAWWTDPARLQGPAAFALEVMRVPAERLETIFGEGEHAGVVRTGRCPVLGPVREHLYWGSMRDRLPAATEDSLASIYGHNVPRHDPGETRGRRLRVSVPDNLCVIRSGQNWSGCDEEELELYDRRLRPALHAGMRFLRDHPADSGCLDLRFANEIEGDRTLKRAFGLGFFLSLAHLEAWAARHPTHLAIFEQMIALATTRGDRLALRLWHEVFVLPSDGQRFEYINCPAATGLLPYFQAYEP